SIRLAYASAASSLADAGRKDEAKKMLNKCDKMMLEENFPYGMASRGQQHNQIALQFLYAAYKAGDTNLVNKITRPLKKDLEQQAAYYQSLPDNKRDNLSDEEGRNDNQLKGLMGLEQQFKNQPIPVENTAPINTQPLRADSPKK
ncbi:MAG TPA: hypothetical protein VK498_05225, partial [Ferruginibacter sp.]|nr:hypothetical protein [Ferruginibacter sp.]